MFSLFRPAHSEDIVEETPLSKFVRESSAKKKQIYKRVISKATAEQNEVLRAAASGVKSRAQKSRD